MCTGASTVSALIHFMMSMITAADTDRTGDDSGRMGDFLCSVIGAAFAGISGDGDDCCLIHCDLKCTAQRTADTGKISFFHDSLRLLFNLDRDFV